MEENNELMTIEENNELEEYEESSCNSGLLNLAIGIGIGAAGTLLAKKGVSKFKSWRKRKKEEIAQCDEDDIELFEEEEDVEVVVEDDETETK